jgi:hypothetical protein
MSDCDFYLLKLWGGPRDGEVWSCDSKPRDPPFKLGIYAPPEAPAQLVDLDKDCDRPFLPVDRYIWTYKQIQSQEPDGFVHYTSCGWFTHN